MFSCEQVLAELSDYLDHSIADGLRKEIEAHMVHCRSCQALYDSTSKTLRIVTESGSFELSEDVSARVASRIRSKIHEK
jgi:predicted anti-sigma-YlaC factor YlaD